MHITIKGGLFFDTDGKRLGLPEWRHVPGLTASYGSSVFVMPLDIAVDVPDDFDPRPAEIAALQARKTAMQAECAKAVTDIERRISELQAITFA